MQKSFASYELDVLHYGFFNVENHTLFLKVHNILKQRIFELDFFRRI